MTNSCTLIYLDLEDAQALARNLEEHLQHDSDCDSEFWGAILTRLNVAIRHSETV
jgi:hypothetical protein